MEPTLQLQRLVDREQLVTLVDRYFAGLDERDLDDALSRTLFTNDVLLEFPLGTIDGVDGLASQHSEVMAHWDRTLHLSTNHRVEVDGDHARINARLVAIHVHPQTDETKQPLVAAHVLEAEAVRAADGWRLSRVALHPAWTAGDVPDGLES